MKGLSISIEEHLEPEALEKLKRRWLQLCARLQLGQEAAAEQWQILSEHYRSPDRYYHNFSHIRNLLELWDAQEQVVEKAGIFELAFWLHDIIYEPLERDNEAASAKWAAEHWNDVLDEQEQELLQHLILSTDGHKAQSNTWTEYFFLDHDLSIFAAVPSDYDDYRAAIQKEYAAVPTEAYRKGRLRVLQNFLNRKRLFLTDSFYEKYEKQARENIQRECRELQEG